MKLNLETLTKQQLIDIENWYIYYIDEDNKLWKKETDKSRSYEKKVAIENIATLSDQLNLMASVLDTITSDNPDQELIASAKTTFAEIKTILTN